jgi:phosphoribosyl-dephospho-CoA transferase
MNAPSRILLRPHDLLWVRAPRAVISPAPWPAWVDASWPLVVRRAEGQGAGLVPVGLRGPLRHQRHAAWLDEAQVSHVLAPEALARSAAWESIPGGGFAALEALHVLAPYLDEIGLPWGPSGSAGFALATGLAVLRADSDLDLLVRAGAAPAARQVEQLKALQGRTRCRLDIQVDTGHGGFALDEWLAGRRQLLLKTARGPLLVEHPWQRPASAEVAQ